MENKMRNIYILKKFFFSVSHSLPHPVLLYNCNTNEDIATKIEEEYFRCVRNEKVYNVVPNIFYGDIWKGEFAKTENEPQTPWKQT